MLVQEADACATVPSQSSVKYELRASWQRVGATSPACNQSAARSLERVTRPQQIGQCRAWWYTPVMQCRA